MHPVETTQQEFTGRRYVHTAPVSEGRAVVPLVHVHTTPLSEGRAVVQLVLMKDGVAYSIDIEVKDLAKLRAPWLKSMVSAMVDEAADHVERLK